MIKWLVVGVLVVVLVVAVVTPALYEVPAGVAAVYRFTKSRPACTLECALRAFLAAATTKRPEQQD